MAKKSTSSVKEIIARHPSPKYKKRTLISTPTEGWIRYEWAHARYSQIIPMNWEASGFDLAFTTMGYAIDDAYNCITRKALELNVEWVIIIEDDVLIHPETFTKFHHYQLEGKYPIVSGLYYLKASPTLPLVFRERGAGAFTNFKLGSKVWATGCGMGCILIHTSLLKWMWNHTEEYRASDGSTYHRVFETPRQVFVDPQTMSYGVASGTQDLHFFDRLVENDVYRKTGWLDIARKKYPILIDTSILCRHIDRSTGQQYP